MGGGPEGLAVRLCVAAALTDEVGVPATDGVKEEERVTEADTDSVRDTLVVRDALDDAVPV